MYVFINISRSLSPGTHKLETKLNQDLSNIKTELTLL